MPILRRPLRPAAALLLLLAAVFAGASLHARAADAYAEYGAPKYPQGFHHFAYVNPDAPKRGTLTLANPDRQTSFDKFNPFTLRGNAAPGIGLLFESLLANSSDEPATGYGLLADGVKVAPDGLSATFHLNPRARFSNGDAVTAADVKYSFDTLVAHGAPALRASLGDIARAVVLDRATVRFDFKRRGRDLPLLAGGIPVFSPRWGEQPDGTRVPFDQLTFETPIGSGPYLIERFSDNRTISYRLDPHYWAHDLPSRRGMFNFARIVYQLYGDDAARLEAFKAGAFDAIVEYRARNWVRSYVGRRFDDGELIKGEFRHHNGAGMQGFFMNTRRPLFRDVRVREALDLAFDFEWADRQLFYGQYVRLDSYFADSEMAASGPPDATQLKLLEPLRAQLDPAVFGPMTTQPSTAPPHSLRDNLRHARELLAAAGWTYRDGALRNADGQPFVFEYLDDSGSAFAQVMPAYARNLAKLGITMTFRGTDFALYQKRLDDFDFDMTTIAMPPVSVPGAEQLVRFGSRAADTPGSDNLAGVRAPAVDALLGELLRAQTREQMLAAARALDRVLMHGYYVVPHWYSNRHRIAYRRMLAHPDTLPLYYQPEDWIVSTWWDES